MVCSRVSHDFVIFLRTVPSFLTIGSTLMVNQEMGNVFLVCWILIRRIRKYLGLPDLDPCGSYFIFVQIGILPMSKKIAKNLDFYCLGTSYYLCYL
jgi:hypothetical protein